MHAPTAIFIQVAASYLCQDFPGLTTEKLKAGIFDGPQIPQLVRDPDSENSMNEVELEARKAFVLVVKNFLGNSKARKARINTFVLSLALLSPQGFTPK